MPFDDIAPAFNGPSAAVLAANPELGLALQGAKLLTSSGGNTAPSRADQNTRTTVSLSTPTSVSVGGINSSGWVVNTGSGSASGGVPLWALGALAALGLGFYAWRHRS